MKTTGRRKLDFKKTTLNNMSATALKEVRGGSVGYQMYYMARPNIMYRPIGSLGPTGDYCYSCGPE